MGESLLSQGRSNSGLCDSIFSLSHNVFKGPLFKGCQKLGLCDKESTSPELYSFRTKKFYVQGR